MFHESVLPYRSIGRARDAARWGGVLIAAALNGVLFAAPEEVVAPPARDARLVTVTLPIEGSDDATLRGVIQRAVDRLRAAPAPSKERRPTLVLEFTAGKGRQESADASQFERSLGIARFLLGDELAGVKTLAYVPEKLRGHAVLVAMACEEIAMAPGAELGAAGAGEDGARQIDPGVIAWYEQIASARQTIPLAIAHGMIDRDAEVLKVESESGIDFVLRRDLEEFESRKSVIAIEGVAPRGALASFTGREARELGLAKYLAADRVALARALDVSVESLAEDQSILAAWRPVIIDIQGPVTDSTSRRAQTLIGTQLQQGINWIGLRIESEGGDWSAGVELASAIAKLRPAEVRTVAYIPQRAGGAAALVALACDQIVMHSDASLGGSGQPPVALRPGKLPPAGAAPPAKKRDQEQQAQQRQAIVETIRARAELSERRPWSLLAAVVEPSIELHKFSNRQTGEIRSMSADEVKGLADAGDWRQGERIGVAGEPLRMTAEFARQIGISSQMVASFDELQAEYGFKQPPPEARPNWANELIQALADTPGLPMFLLLIGFVGIYIELNTPGIGIGGFVSAVSFLLFFWSHSLNGEATWLEALLFVAGILFILLEALVLPGVGIFGLGGAVMVIASLVLASQTFVLPQTDAQLAELRGSLTTVTGAFLTFLVAGAILRRILPETRLFRQMLLAPPEAAELVELERRETVADYTHLVGRQGLAVTNLMPSGKADFDGELVDVIAEGQVVDRGARVEVLSARGPRVMVRQLRG